jgi:hypothetical protein
VRRLAYALPSRVVAVARRGQHVRRGAGWAARRAAGAASCRSTPWRPRQHGRYTFG